MFGLGGWERRESRNRARDRASWLIRDHGDKAEAMLAEQLASGDLSVARRARLRLVLSAVHRKRRRDTAASPRGRSGPGWLARLAAMLGNRLGHRRSSRRDP